MSAVVQESPPQRLAYPLLLMLGAVDAAAYSVIAPVVPQIADETGAGPAVMGVFVATFPLGMMAGFAMVGRLAARSPTAAVAVSVVVLAVGAGGFVVGDGSLAVYFAARLVMGLGSGGLWLGVTFNTLERWPGQEYACLSLVLSAYSAGGVLGPALGAVEGVAGPFTAYLALLGIALLASVTLGSPPRRRPLQTDRSTLRSSGFWTASAAVLFVSGARGGGGHSAAPPR